MALDGSSRSRIRHPEDGEELPREAVTCESQAIHLFMKPRSQHGIFSNSIWSLIQASSWREVDSQGCKWSTPHMARVPLIMLGSFSNPSNNRRGVAYLTFSRLLLHATINVAPKYNMGSSFFVCRAMICKAWKPPPSFGITYVHEFFSKLVLPFTFRSLPR